MKLPEYETPTDYRCPECGNLTTIVARDDSFSYPATHCNYGKSGTHYPPDWGHPETECCGYLLDVDEDGPVIDWQEQENLAEAAFEEVEGRLWRDCETPFAENH